MAWFDQFISGLGQQNAPFGFDAQPVVGAPSQDNPAYRSGMQMLGNIGAGMLASGSRNPAQAFGRAYLGAQEQAQQQNKNQYIAAEMMTAAEEKKQKRQEEAELRQKRNDWLKSVSDPNRRSMLEAYPELTDEYIQATDPLFKDPIDPSDRYKVVGNKIYDVVDQTWIEGGGGGSIEAPPVKTIYDKATGQEQVVEWTGSEWKPLGGKKAKGDSRSSATELKELWQSEDEIPALDGTISSLNRALELNKKTFTGVTAGVRGWAGTAIPGAGMVMDPNAAAATREFGQIMSLEAIKSMAETLKGATTDRELSQFVEILADPSTPPDIRERTITRMITLAERQKAIKMQRVNELRGSSSGQSGATGNAPDGVTSEEWNAMTPEERAAWE
jgi:hypothetical protein